MTEEEDNGEQQQTTQEDTTTNDGDGDNCSSKIDDNTTIKSPAWTDEQFEAFLHQELNDHPLSKDYPELFATAPKLICKWRQRYQGNPKLWKRLFNKDKVIKEFVESAPVIAAVEQLVLNADLEEGKKYTIIDLACGKGYLSMLLSELLPPSKVDKFILVDKQWAQHNLEPMSHHMSWTHIYGSSKECEDQTIPCYYETWPISLNTAKVNLKRSKELQAIEQRLITNKGPTIIVAVHLCGTLSLKAVHLFNNNPEVKLICLKPCCLPGMVHAKRDEIFKLGDHSFDAKLVCTHGRWKRGGIWSGPPRNACKPYFERWVENLYEGISDLDAKKAKKTEVVQYKGGYQNEFLFAERLPETRSLWDMLQQQEGETESA